MHDPRTQAFNFGNWLTIWHDDPMNFDGKVNCRSDDSCGWFTPPYSQAERDAIEKMANWQYREIFQYQIATTEGRDYAYIMSPPDCQSAIYWSWRAIKHHYKPAGPWQYGCRMTASEKDRIYELATSPIDNLQFSFRSIKDEDSFRTFFLYVLNAYLRHSRPWYRHPRWHFWHWRFQFHHVQLFKRWAFSRCAGCGGRFTWGYAPVTADWYGTGPRWFSPERGVYHSKCFKPEAYVAENPYD